MTVSRSFYEVFKVKPEETVGHLIYDLGNKQWDIPKLRELLENILPAKTVFDNYEVEHDFATIGLRTMLLNARQIRRSSGKERIILLAIEDITERKGAENRIQKLLAEKDIILKEVHHRTKNSMNTIKGLLNLQANMLTDPAAIEALKDTESRVQSMMVLYDKLYRSIDYREISMKDYLDTLVDEVISNFPNNRLVNVVKAIADFQVSAKIMQSLGIIVNELLTNIMKYAFVGRDRGTISVCAKQSSEAVTIVIQDNGVGFPAATDRQSPTGFGLTLVQTLIEQLKGTIRFGQDNGTTVCLTFQL